jgi:adenylate cyclase, class 2
MPYEEIEVKFIVDDLPAMRQRVLAMGAQLKTPRTYEENLRFDTPEQRLARQGCLLRLRRDSRNLVTYKEPTAQRDTEFKVLHEYEVEVNDFDQMLLLFEKLGFAPSQRFEKYRETFVYQEAEILLDEVPFGTFLEIEGQRATIRTIVTALGLDFAARLTSSYNDIFEAVRTTYRLPFHDMTFAPFQALQIDLHACNLT